MKDRFEFWLLIVAAVLAAAYVVAAYYFAVPTLPELPAARCQMNADELIDLWVERVRQGEYVELPWRPLRQTIFKDGMPHESWQRMVERFAACGVVAREDRRVSGGRCGLFCLGLNSPVKRIPYDQKRPMEDRPLCAGSFEPGWVCTVHSQLPWKHDGCGWESSPCPCATIPCARPSRC